MKTFTVRDLDRAPGSVLAACDAEGIALIRSRSGKNYEIRPVTLQNTLNNLDARKKWMVRHKEWVSQNPMPSLSPSQFEELDRMLAGE